jgi:hypothetical protein
MRKLQLKLDALRVDTFETAAREKDQGTVRAFASTGHDIICQCTFDVGTCDNTCPDTCRAGCGGGTGTGTGLPTNPVTCATGHQIICGCAG